MFRTELKLKKDRWSIDHNTPIMTIGSCFSDQIGNLFAKNKFTTLPNPFGTVYNPISICHLLHQTIEKTLPSPDSYVSQKGLHSNYYFHSSFSSTDIKEVQNGIEISLAKAHDFLSKADFLIITLGTSYIYERRDNHAIVANCHKVPAAAFNKRLLTLGEIIDSFDSLYKLLDTFNNRLKIIVTVSPVRHIKDTLELNSVSKSLLRLACHAITEQYENIKYFPSYELVLDDLRDYRFYKPDMLHPNEVAEDYIWKEFSKAYFNNDTIELINEWSKILNAVNHKAYTPDSIEHQKFLQQTLHKLKSIGDIISVDQEIEMIKKQIIS